MPSQVKHKELTGASFTMQDADVPLGRINGLQRNGDVAYLVEGPLIYCVNSFHGSGQAGKKRRRVLAAPRQLSLDASSEIRAGADSQSCWERRRQEGEK